MKMEHTECSKMLAYKIQTPGKYSEESLQYSGQGESLKSIIINIIKEANLLLSLLLLLSSFWLHLNNLPIDKNLTKQLNL